MNNEGYGLVITEGDGMGISPEAINLAMIEEGDGYFVSDADGYAIDLNPISI